MYTLLLLGIGLRRFSMAPATSRRSRRSSGRSVSPRRSGSPRALTFDTDRQVTNYLRDETRKIAPDLI